MCLLPLLAASVVAGVQIPVRLAAVDIRIGFPLSKTATAYVSSSVIGATGATRLRSYGRTENYYLVADDAQVLGLRTVSIDLDPHRPAYLVYVTRPEVRERVSRIAPVLFQDGDAVLLQLDDAQALRAVQMGAEIVRLPDEPHQVWMPEPACLPAGRPGFAIPTLSDTFVQRLVNLVSADSIHSHIQRLQDVRTRFSPAESCRAAEQHVHDYFVSLGLDSVELDSYPQQGDTWRNVIGTKLGRAHPEKFFIICGHMDAISEDPWNLAPGAEDNGSGAAMGIEAARILVNERLDQTVKFICFTGEEQGLFGSAHYAQKMRSRGAEIVGVINFDMVAWPGGSWGISLVGLPEAQRLVRLQAQMATLYTNLDHRISVRSFPSDSRSFEEAGYVATSGYEFGTIPYRWYHTTGDTLGNLSMPLAREVAKMCVATLATLAVAPLPPEGLVLADAGSGTSLRASWRPAQEPDLAGYKLLWGTASRSYDDSVVLGLENSALISGLQSGTRYYATVVACDSAGHESGWSNEDSAIPMLTPLPPVGPEAWPFRYGMELSWLRNRELDLAGYNLYRSTVSGSNYERLNPNLLRDTTYEDSGLVSDTMYYYVVTAVDTGANESGYSPEVRGKPVTLDHGILLVDETRDGNGQPGSPNDEQQDAFYHEMLQGFQYADWDVAESGVPQAGDLGPYSTIVWHGDEYQQQSIAQGLPGLANHLDNGGRVWLVGWKPVYGLMNRSGSYPYDFAPGQFAYDYLHLSRSEESPKFDFIGAEGQAGYPSVTVDSTKLTSQLHGRMPYIDAILPRGSPPRDAETILSFSSFSGDTFQGKPVGVRWLGEPYRTALFGFPLYYMRTGEARLLAVKTLADLGEPYAIAEDQAHGDRPLVTVSFGSSPFRRELSIGYFLPHAARVRLALYDGLGRPVQEPLHQIQVRGNHVLRLDATELASGVYFCRFEAGSFLTTRKVTLAR